MRNTRSRQNFILLLFSFVLFFLLFSFVVIDKTYSAFAADSENIGEISVLAENGLSFSFQETTTGETLSQDNSFMFTASYKGQNYEIEAVVDTDLVEINGELSYRWFYSATNAGNVDLSLYKEIENLQEPILSVKDCKDTGFYILAVYDADGLVGNSQVIGVTINKTNLIITKGTPIKKEFDGSTLIQFDVEQTGFVDENESVIVTGHVSSADVGDGKLVSNIYVGFTNSNLEDNYEVQVNFNTNNLVVDITKKKVLMNWNITEGAVYNGKSHRDKISPYYKDISGSRQFLNYSVTGNNFFGQPINNSDLILAGYYTLTLAPLEKDKNYDFYTSLEPETKANQFSFEIARAQPEFLYTKTNFVYTGIEQDIKDYVYINNSEQILSFFPDNTTFTTVEEAQNLIGKIEIRVSRSANYAEWEEDFPLTIEKAVPVVDMSNVKTDYIYNGEIQSFDNSSIIINNNEQVVVSSVENFQDVGSYIVKLQINESANYQALALSDLTINMLKKSIDVSNFTWRDTGTLFYEQNVVHTVSLLTSSAYVKPIYSGTYSASDAGTYIASVSYELYDSKNYEVVGRTQDLIWTINKRIINIPSVLPEQEFVYDGTEKIVNFTNSNSSYFTILGNRATNAGEYTITIKLNDTANTIWSNGNTNPIEYNWQINKASVQVPNFSTRIHYTGNVVSLDVEENELYLVSNNSGVVPGDYTAILMLKDPYNYKWERTDSPYIEINWSIGGNVEEGDPVPILAIVISVIVIVVIAIFITLQFTVVKKKKKTSNKPEEKNSKL